MKISTIVPKYKIITPVKTNPGDNIQIYDRPLTISQLERYILKPVSRDIVAIDLETRGLTPFYPHVYKDMSHKPAIMGVGFGYSTKQEYKGAYINLTRQSIPTLKHLCKRLGDLHLIAHNAMFDGLGLRHLGLTLGVDVRPNWVGCTYGWFKQLASQDFIGQRHGLKDAQVNLLGWDAKGDIELDNWLIDNGYFTKSTKKGVTTLRPTKGEMWRAPIETLGHYCALDCISTLQLFDKVFEPTIKKHPMLWEYHDKPFIRSIHEIIDQQIDGTPVDLPLLKKHKSQVEENIASIKKEFFALPEVIPHLEEWRDLKISKVNVPKKLKKNPVKKLKFPLEDVRAINPHESEVYIDDTLVGSLVHYLIGEPAFHEVSKTYLNYLGKLEVMRNDPEYLFNPNSGDQLRWLFYEKLYTATKEDITFNYRDITCYRLQSPRGEILLPATDSGEAPTDKKATPWLGDAGEILGRLAKEKTLVTTFLDPYIKFATTSFDGRMHPGYKVPEAVTGRLGGSKPNMQQISGDPRLLECLPADPGRFMVEADFKALEDYVAANVTLCPGLLALYGPDATENDGHLWLGAKLPVIGEEIRRYYDPDNPTPESIDKAKEFCKKERDISKAVKYSATYGIGVFKLWQDLMAAGIKVTLEDVSQIHRGYWEVFWGMKEHKWVLQDEWERNRGWIKNAIGRPMPVGDHHAKKDLFSRCVQGGGHDLNMMFGEAIADLVKKYNLDAKPYIFDLHDAVYYQVKEEQLEEYKAVTQEATKVVWEFCKNDLGWVCELKTSIAYGRNLKELKGYK
jgi:DNA polymerase I-like protein with 3'-5' exonuclease and polymerase domains